MSAAQWLENHAGEACDSCGVSYEACTSRILDKGLRACCGSCGHTDTHRERKVVPTDTTYEARLLGDDLRTRVAARFCSGDPDDGPCHAHREATDGVLDALVAELESSS